MINPLSIEKSLQDALGRHLQGVPTHLRESISYSVLSGGKRIRPRLLYATADYLDLDQQVAEKAAVAIELIHCFTLIHDDLPCMDNDDFRRGKPSNHKKFGEATALLAGDALVPLAFDVLLEAHTKTAPDALARSLKRLSEATGARGVIGGQSAELVLFASPSLENLRYVHSKKTGALFEASVMLAADLANLLPEEAVHTGLGRFSNALGSAFQIADDLEDKDKEITPLSILHYMTAEDAITLASDQLKYSLSALMKVKSMRIEGLSSVAEEVIHKLRDTQ